MTRPKPLWISIAFLALAALGMAVLLFRPTEEDRINAEIDRANYCQTASDCEAVYAQCPFNCYAPVHKSQARRIEGLIAGYRSTCAYSCIAIEGVDCVSGRCQVRTAAPDSYQPERMTLSGTYVCLERTDGQKTEACEPGMRAGDNDLYALDFMLMSAIPPVLNPGDRFNAGGVFVPLERLSTDKWVNYGVKGIFSVTDLTK